MIRDTRSPTPPDRSAKGNAVVTYTLRIVFVLVLCGVGAKVAFDERIAGAEGVAGPWVIYLAFFVTAVIVIAVDVFFIPRKSLAAISGVFFGLIVGMVFAYGLSLIIDLLFSSNVPGSLPESQVLLVGSVKLAIGVICCYMAVSFVLHTKDDVRFIIPYVEFAKETKGGRPLVLDTSVIVDGRIADIANTRILTSDLIVPRFVLNELQTIADSSDKLKRSRGRRGLDMLNKLQANENVDLRVLDVVAEGSAADANVDEMLVDLALQLSGKVITNDFNLNKIAQLRGVGVININDLANALKPVVLPGEAMQVKVIKPGEEAGQGVGYLDDGTMVVAEGARDHIGEVIDLTVTSVLQTSAGRMIFGRYDGASGNEKESRFGDRHGRTDDRHR